MNEPTKITDGLYLGNKKSINRRAFDGIVSVMLNPPNLEVIDKRYTKRLVIELQDSIDDDIKSHMNEATSFINEIILKDGEVLVHCKMGVSRSCSIILGYLMKYKKMSLLDGYQLVRSKRSTVRPNYGFWRQLIEIEKELFAGRSSVSFITLPNNHSVPSVYEEEFQSMVFL